MADVTTARKSTRVDHRAQEEKSRALALNANKKKLRRPVYGVVRSIGTGCPGGLRRSTGRIEGVPAHSLLPSGAVVSASDRSMSRSTVHEARRGIAGRVDARWRHRGREQQSKQRPERCLVERRRFEQRPCIDSRSTGAVMDDAATPFFDFLLSFFVSAQS